MPIYEYVCTDGHRTDRAIPMVKGSEPRTVRCRRGVPDRRGEACGKRARRTEISRVGVSFNAPGFTRRVIP